MKLDSCGILISLRPFDEHNALACIFSRDFGKMTALLRGALNTKKNKPLVGQCGNVSWNARLDSSLGVFHWEAEKNLGAPIMLQPKVLPYMNASFDLIATLLPEREEYMKLYDATQDLLEKLATTTESAELYLNWELELLRELGYALDLRRCSGCGGTENLHYLSPKTGRAVCDKCAAPYLARLYKLPITLDTTVRFLENICEQQGTKVPQFRIFLNSKKI